MNILEMTRDDFLNLPHRKWGEDIGEFDSLVIIPMDDIHESGYRMMDFAAIRDGVPICLLAGESDVLHIDGIGGIGRSSPFRPPSKRDAPLDWTMDCLPGSGLLSLWCRHKLTADDALSSFQLFARKAG